MNKLLLVVLICTVFCNMVGHAKSKSKSRFVACSKPCVPGQKTYCQEYKSITECKRKLRLQKGKHTQICREVAPGAKIAGLINRCPKIGAKNSTSRMRRTMKTKTNSTKRRKTLKRQQSAIRNINRKSTTRRMVPKTSGTTRGRRKAKRAQPTKSQTNRTSTTATVITKTSSTTSTPSSKTTTTVPKTFGMTSGPSSTTTTTEPKTIDLDNGQRQCWVNFAGECKKVIIRFEYPCQEYPHALYHYSTENECNTEVKRICYAADDDGVCKDVYRHGERCRGHSDQQTCEKNRVSYECYKFDKNSKSCDKFSTFKWCETMTDSYQYIRECQDENGLKCSKYDEVKKECVYGYASTESGHCDAASGLMTEYDCIGLHFGPPK